MSILLSFLLSTNCFAAKYIVKDCINMAIMKIDKNNEWTSEGYYLGSFQITEVLKKYYKMKVIRLEKNSVDIEGIYAMPIKELDNFSATHRFWELENRHNCNKERNK